MNRKYRELPKRKETPSAWERVTDSWDVNADICGGDDVGRRGR